MPTSTRRRSAASRSSPAPAARPRTWKKPRALGADTYVTGEGSIFTRLFAKETQLNLVFGTHQATEAPGIKALGQRISEEAQIPWEFIPESSDVF